MQSVKIFRHHVLSFVLFTSNAHTLVHTLTSTTLADEVCCVVSAQARRALGDFGVPIAIAVMVTVDILIKETYTEKLDVPDGLQPTNSTKRGWFINPMGQDKDLPMWGIFAAAIPALLVFILIFMETMITK